MQIKQANLYPDIKNMNLMAARAIDPKSGQIDMRASDAARGSE